MSYFILADCNNFYVSCERLLNPKLENRPVIVLSNNDGCVIARSQEAKDFGIKMGEPYFKIKTICERLKIIVHSSNYALYGDISRRIMNIFTQEAPELQIYSIDEAFLKYPSTISHTDLLILANQLRTKIKRWVGIPVSFGIGPTKTLAKVANHLAKKNKKPVFDLCFEDHRKEQFKDFPMNDVWGIGSGFNARLQGMGIYTVADFIKTEPLLIRRKMGVVGERMLWELRGICCLDLEKVESKKSITCSRSFGQFLSDETKISEALSTFVARGCEKLRKQKSYAKSIYVFLETNQLPSLEYSRLQFNATATFETPNSDTPTCIAYARKCLKQIFRENQCYKKCGVVFLDLIDEKNSVPDLFVAPIDPKRNALMQMVDELNERFGKDKLFFGSMGTHSEWKMRCDFRSCYNTTDWDLLPLVRC